MRPTRYHGMRAQRATATFTLMQKNIRASGNYLPDESGRADETTPIETET